MWWRSGTSVHLPGIEPILSGCPGNSLVQSQVFVGHRLYEACHFILCDPDIDPVLIAECDLAQHQSFLFIYSLFIESITFLAQGHNLDDVHIFKQNV
jgi:hypothetical protein